MNATYPRITNGRDIEVRQNSFVGIPGDSEATYKLANEGDRGAIRVKVPMGEDLFVVVADPKQALVDNLKAVRSPHRMFEEKVVDLFEAGRNAFRMIGL